MVSQFKIFPSFFFTKRLTSLINKEGSRNEYIALSQDEKSRSAFDKKGILRKDDFCALVLYFKFFDDFIVLRKTKKVAVQKLIKPCENQNVVK